MATNMTTNKKLISWIEEIKGLCKPDRVHWCDSSDEEAQKLYEEMIANGSTTMLNSGKRPESYLFRSHPSDVARVEDRTYISTSEREDAGPTNNWIAPDEVKKIMLAMYDGCMVGRTLYVIPFCMGPLNSPFSKIGIEITDSPYVVVNMKIMTRMGRAVLDMLGEDGEFIPCLHSIGAPLKAGEKDVPWPCAPIEKKYITHFPEEKSIWSFGSGYGGNALLGKKCLALRIASVQARDEGWMAEHMLILSITSPENKTYYITAAFPSACGKTNLAMMEPTLPGWRIKCIGDDIAWMRIGKNGRLYAVNPEYGFFGVAPGTSVKSNPHAMEAISKNTIFTNVLQTEDNDVWWEDMGIHPPERGIDWEGNPWIPSSSKKGAHPNARFTAPASQCPVIDPEWENPEGVPISAILFGGRRPSTIPVVNESLDWLHGVFMGSATGSETTAANIGKVGVVRRDPFAMIPFCGYNMADYFAHWIKMGERLKEKAPKIFFVNWFRKDEKDLFMWPGYGENSRILKYIVERIENKNIGKETAIGILPKEDALDIAGLNISHDTLKRLLKIDTEGWREEIKSIEDFYSRFGSRLPHALKDQLEKLKNRIG